MNRHRFYRFHKMSLYLVVVLGAVFLVTPTLIIMPLSFNAVPYFTYPIEAYSLRWYQDVFTLPGWRTGFRNSVIVAATTTSIATVLGTLAALGLAELPPSWRQRLMLVLLSPLIIPIIVFAVGIFYLAARIGMVGSLATLIWAHAVLALPFVILVVSASLERFDRTLLMAAYSLGASPLQAFRRITLPLIAPGVFAGAVFAFVTSWDEIVVALFIAGGPENHTLPRRLWSGLREELSPAIIAVATLLTLLSLVLMSVVEWLRRRSGLSRPLAH